MSRTLMTVLGVLLALTILGTNANAQYFGKNKVQYETFDFKIFNTEHFRIHFYGAQERIIPSIGRMAEGWYQRHRNSFGHVFRGQKPLIFYANGPDFQQTTVVRGYLGQGVGGVTEPLKQRVVMPLTGLPSETSHVLGHELVHSFQFDIGLARQDTASFSFDRVPSWLVEGMAEYLSRGAHDPHTAMWMRDAALRGDLPTIEELRTGEYFPYRYGQAYLAYVGKVWNDQKVTQLFVRAGQIGVRAAIENVLEVPAESLSETWKQAAREQYLPVEDFRTPPLAVGQAIFDDESDVGSRQLGPVVGPDGEKVALLAREDLFTRTVLIADIETGEIIRELGTVGSNPHLDALRFVESAGTWSPEGDRFAFATFTDGDNKLTIVDVTTGEVERTIGFEQVGALKNPAWSPSGSRIVFSGIHGGVSDLYSVHLPTGKVTALTDDRYAQLQPDWGPKGEKLVYMTDRGGSDFARLQFAAPRLGLLSLTSGKRVTITPFPGHLHSNPKFSLHGDDIYFISSPNGFKDVYRFNLANQTSYRVTALTTGVSGITSLSPALSVAQSTGDLIFSVFTNNEYHLRRLPADSADGGTPVSPQMHAADGMLPLPAEMPIGYASVDLGRSPRFVLPYYDVEYYDYTPTLSMARMISPRAGISGGGVGGARLSGGAGFVFSDMLGRHRLTTMLQLRGSFKDLGGQIGYQNQKYQLNFGGALSHSPRRRTTLNVETTVDEETNTQFRRVNRLTRRTFVDQAILSGSYPRSRTRRFELNLSGVRYSFDFQLDSRLYAAGRVVSDTTLTLEGAEPEPVYMGRTAVAYVGDNSQSGYTSPFAGSRFRFELQPQFGRHSYLSFLADYRKYWYAEPVSFAVRGLHIGNYFTGAENLFNTEFLGMPNTLGFVRGYSARSMTSKDCTAGGRCFDEGRLLGTRIAMASAEIRVPVFGGRRLGLVPFRLLPLDMFVFADVGTAWTAEESFSLSPGDPSDRLFEPIVSTGAGARVNILGRFVVEAYLAFPFQRPQTGPQLGFQLSPGW